MLYSHSRTGQWGNFFKVRLDLDQLLSYLIYVIEYHGRYTTFPELLT